MTPDEIKSAITGWCSQDTGLQLVEDRSEPGGGFALGLRSGAFGAGTLPVDVSLESGSDRVTVRSTSTSSAGSQEVKALLDGRPASVRGETSGTTVVVTAHAFTDGFNKNVFTRTVDEVAKTRALIDGLGSGAVAASATGAATAAASASPSPWTASSLPIESAQPVASPLPSPSFGSPAGAATYAPPTGQPAPQAQPVATAFAPTHTVPPQGMQAWAAPDPSGAVVATLGGGLPIQVSEVRGAWARVLCSNGWTGWVDGRIIGVAR
jgi:hypothetical protein